MIPPALDPRIDFSRIQMLEEAGVDSGSGLLEKLLRIFYSTTLERLDEMEKLLEQRSFPEIARVAHNLRASCGTFGATAMADLAREIEHGARTNQVTLIPEAVLTLKRLFPEVQAQIQAHLATTGNAGSTLSTDTSEKPRVSPVGQG